MSIAGLRKSNNTKTSCFLLRQLRAEALYRELQRERFILFDDSTYRQFESEGYRPEVVDQMIEDLAESQRAEIQLSGITIRLVLALAEKSAA